MAQAPHIRLRIIAGKWRRSIIETPALEGVRPTASRLRETLFNWLANTIPNARCCDAFAGTGILGLEALSRGAARCCFVDTSREAVEAINQHLMKFSVGMQARCLTISADQISLPADSIDVLFLDPPFDSNLLEKTLKHFIASGCLSSKAMVYVEYKRASRPNLPDGWYWHRDVSTKQVGYGLLAREENHA